MNNEKLLKSINKKQINAGKKANSILQLMNNENLPCTFNEALQLAIKVNLDEIDFNIFFNNYKEIIKNNAILN